MAVIPTIAVAVVETDGNSKLIYYKKRVHLMSSFFMPQTVPGILKEVFSSPIPCLFQINQVVVQKTKCL